MVKSLVRDFGRPLFNIGFWRRLFMIFSISKYTSGQYMIKDKAQLGY